MNRPRDSSSSNSNSIITMSSGLINAILLFSLLNLIMLASATFEHEKGSVIIKKVKMARQFTVAHNTVRFSLGLPPVTWNRTLARYARRWAGKRAGDCELIHSPDSPYGENLFWSLKGHWSPGDVVKCWADEGVYYNPKTNQCINGEICGHYTQLIWKNTKQIGCGKKECDANKGFLYVCTYNPPGNYYFEGPLGGRFPNSIIDPSL